MEEPVLLLLAEDEALIRMLLEETLRDASFDLVVASSGHEAMAELEASAERLRGLVTDVRLGTGPSGWDLARRARELVPDIPVVYTSGDSASDWTAQGVPNSVMVSKPFVPAQIITAMTSLLNGVVPP